MPVFACAFGFILIDDLHAVVVDIGLIWNPYIFGGAIIGFKIEDIIILYFGTFFIDTFVFIDQIMRYHLLPSGI